MQKTAEMVSLGHPDKTADYISSYLLDRMIEQDSTVKYAVEVLIKDHTVVLAGEIYGNVSIHDHHLTEYVKAALREIGYSETYTALWGSYALDLTQLKILNLIGLQSPEINQGVTRDGWGDQGVFVGYACQGAAFINRELYLARKLNNALYQKALNSSNLGIDIKTQITLDTAGNIEVAVVAIPMLEEENLLPLISSILGELPSKTIVNGTGAYKYHSAIADCGITGRKLACDFYSVASPIGGGSPWTKDGSKADLSLNLYARKLALQHLKDNDECFVYLSSCIGQHQLPSAVLQTVKNGIKKSTSLAFNKKPSEIIQELALNTPIFTRLCRNGLFSIEP